jgi:hypothetical protein
MIIKYFDDSGAIFMLLCRSDVVVAHTIFSLCHKAKTDSTLALPPHPHHDIGVKVN